MCHGGTGIDVTEVIPMSKTAIATYIQELTVPPVWEPSDVSLCMLSADKGRSLGRLKIVNISWYNFFNPLSNVKGGAGWLAG